MIGERLAAVSDWLSEHSIAVAIVSGASVLVWGYSGYPVPEIKTVYIVAVASFVAAVIAGYFAGKWVIDYLHDPDVVFLHDVDPATGDLTGFEITPEQFKNMIVVNKNGKRKSKSDLKRIETPQYERAYEVRGYNPDTNVATTTWMGGVTQLDIRKHENNLKHVEEELSKEADAYVELKSSLKPVVRSCVKKISNWMIATSEGVDVPRGGVIKETIDDSIEEQGIDDLPTPDEIKLEGERRDDGELPSLAGDDIDSNRGGEQS